jgi:hypothetical protein
VSGWVLERRGVPTDPHDVGDQCAVLEEPVGTSAATRQLDPGRRPRVQAGEHVAVVLQADADKSGLGAGGVHAAVELVDHGRRALQRGQLPVVVATERRRSTGPGLIEVDRRHAAVGADVQSAVTGRHLGGERQRVQVGVPVAT